MNDLNLFNYNGHAVRSRMEGDGPIAVAKDIAPILGYVDPKAMTRYLDADEKGVSKWHTPGGEQEFVHLTEAGLFAAIMRSTSPNAKPFRRWVTHEVLPAIRQTGSYSQEKPLTGAELMAKALVEAHSTLESYHTRVAELEPLAASWEKLASATGDYSVRDAAQVLCRDGGIQIGQNRLFRYLRECARPWLDTGSRPYQWAVDQGLVAEKISSFKFQRTNGEEQLATPQVRITAKGLQRLHRDLSPSQALVVSR